MKKRNEQSAALATAVSVLGQLVVVNNHQLRLCPRRLWFPAIVAASLLGVCEHFWSSFVRVHHTHE